ncbi:hypothetical protein H0H93_007455 [Arthromyces matolae]|nr:hypothetical protein H0H93_007455 [Arthromyces matolae]
MSPPSDLDASFVLVNDCPAKIDASANDDHNTFPVGADSVTFVGRPFPLEEAPQHFARLRRWGLTFIHLLVTWEMYLELHDVWGWDRTRDEPVLLRENYFVKNRATGGKVDWYTDFYFPFLSRWTERVRRASAQEKIVFVEAIPNEFCPTSWTPKHQVPNMVYAPHWYDLNALCTKSFGDFTVNVQGLSRGMFPLKAFYWGQHGARENFSSQICNLVEHTHKSLGERPILPKSLLVSSYPNILPYILGPTSSLVTPIFTKRLSQSNNSDGRGSQPKAFEPMETKIRDIHTRSCEMDVVQVEIDTSAGKENLVARVAAGISDLLGSAFTSFVGDEYTTLAEVDDRIFSTAVDLQYSFAAINLTAPTDEKKLEFKISHH